MGLGTGTNNLAELLALKLLLQFAGEKGVQNLQIFGDSKIVINWASKQQSCHNILLHPILEEIFRLLHTLNDYSFNHVYRERNQLVDSLSKVGLHLPHGSWHILETKEEDTYEFFHRPFIEALG
jgi:ribonuclease HI